MMSLFSKCRHWWLHKHACIFNDRAGSAACGSVQYVYCVSTTGAGWISLQHPVWRRDLIMEEVRGISNSIPFVADISMERLHQHTNGLHHYGVEGTTACKGSSWIHSIRRHSINNSHIICRSDEEGHGRVSYRIDQGELIKASKEELSFPIHHKSWGKQLQFCNRTIQLQE